MIIAYSFWTGDADQALETARLIAELGPYPKHDALVIAPLGTAYITEITDLFESSFRSVRFQAVKHTYTGWPIAPNQTFWETAAALAAQRDPFFWFEPDLVPVKRDWLTQMSAEYREHGADNLGILAEADGRKFFVGTAIYAPTILKTSPILRNIPNMSDVAYRSGSIPLAFDVKAGPEVIRHGARTRQMQHVWKSRDYSIRDGVIEVVTSNGERVKILPDTCVVHGCKDISLHKCVRELLGLAAKTEAPPSPFERTESAEVFEAYKRKLEELEDAQDAALCNERQSEPRTLLDEAVKECVEINLASPTTVEPKPFVELSRTQLRNLSEAERLEYDKHWCAMKYGKKDPPFKGPCHGKMKYKRMAEAARNLGKPTEKGWTKPEVIEYLSAMDAWDSAHDAKLRDIEREAVARGAEQRIQLI